MGSYILEVGHGRRSQTFPAVDSGEVEELLAGPVVSALRRLQRAESLRWQGMSALADLRQWVHKSVGIIRLDADTLSHELAGRKGKVALDPDEDMHHFSREAIASPVTTSVLPIFGMPDWSFLK